jgi:hypothetical protein
MRTPKPPTNPLEPDRWQGRGGLLHRIRVAQHKSAQAEKVTDVRWGIPRHRKPSMPKLPWDKEPE